MRIILALFLGLNFINSNSQEFKEDSIIGSWTLDSIKFTGLCHPNKSQTDKARQELIIFESGQFILYSEEFEENIQKETVGLWKITTGNKITFIIEGEVIILDVKIRNEKLYLSNKLAVLEYVRK